MTQETSNPFVTKVLLRQSISSVRLVIALFTVGAIVIKLLYSRFVPGLNDLNELRWTIIGLGCLFFVTTYFKYRRALVVSYFSFCLYLLTLSYVIAFVIINQFHPNAVAILILVVGASTIVFNSLIYYGAQCFAIVLASLIAYSKSSLSNENLIAFFNLVIAQAVFGIVIAVRLKLISSLRKTHSDLEKLNVLSIVANKKGEIVFISPSVQGLLGYEPKELVKEGWWSSPNVCEGWISREYILNYPNFLPKEIASIETRVLNKEGKTVWLNWANSMLPNGDYMGVALDVTKYKTSPVEMETSG